MLYGKDIKKSFFIYCLKFFFSFFVDTINNAFIPVPNNFEYYDFVKKLLQLPKKIIKFLKASN